VESMKQTGEQITVKLTKPIAVYFTYVTAWATPDGTVNFRPDIYGHDGSAETTASAY
jgi:murein L,D-transpeptidase YcbB/YkuD